MSRGPVPMHSQQPPGVVQNWSTLQCSEQNTEQCGYDHALVTRGRMRAQFPLPHGPHPWLDAPLTPRPTPPPTPSCPPPPPPPPPPPRVLKDSWGVGRIRTVGSRPPVGWTAGEVAELVRYVKWAGKTRGRREKRGTRPFSDLVGRAGRPGKGGRRWMRGGGGGCWERRSRG